MPVSYLLIAVAVLPLLPIVAMAEDTELKLPDDVVAYRDQVYAVRASGPVKLDIFAPPGNGPFPVVMWIHGGGWKMGDKSEWPHMNHLVREGFAVVNVGYRFSQVAKFPAQLEDCTAALEFVATSAEKYHLDAARLAVTGESAGGHLAALVGMSRPPSTTQPAAVRVRAVIDLFGPTDVTLFSRPDHPGNSFDQLLGGPVAANIALARSASPMYHVAADNPPCLILHGTKDPLVPLSQSETFTAALKSAHVPVEFVPVEGAGHAGPAFWTEPMRVKMLAFLKRNLGL